MSETDEQLDYSIQTGFQIWLLSKKIDLNSRGAVASGVGRGVSICASANKLVLGGKDDRRVVLVGNGVAWSMLE